jgi:hypothetical protein
MQIINPREPKEVAFFIIGGVCAMVLLIVVIGLAVSIFTMNGEQLVSGPLQLSSQWVEISPSRPMEPRKQSQELVLVVDSSQRLNDDNSQQQVVLADGTFVNVDVQLVDRDGNVTEAKVVKAPTPSLYENAIIAWPAFEGSFASVRLRSDQPLHLAKIVWHCWRGK